ncbi:hypothetical protein L198_04775 [Cryptococcus wingfieldii CBS 7118]|uniref:Epoxide hydrolase N-terminal domain-containing protein n=1 Tax=Cryptococcus wingfieldii CBS 7118 TaxID=1295528 RepID=A0A1E3J3E9_9TREE|nr:hypothetical protein L198_04775 [Cryptococcus wingfieldii CBS 7118]ODN94636.1 hypothetical protein L198_04775 [Cryptococcus wingfieldii CBS 7118]
MSKTLLRLSRIPRETYESVNANRENKFGMTTVRLRKLRDAWSEFDWIGGLRLLQWLEDPLGIVLMSGKRRKQEEYINSHPQFISISKAKDGKDLKIQFAALFSRNFLEFYGILDLVKKQYTPETLPYHIIVPYLLGYAFSSPPLEGPFSVQDVAFVLNNLMKGLGFGGGYMAQGGDVGSFVTNALGMYPNECKLIHLNFRLSLASASGSTESKKPTDKAFDPLLPLQTFGYALEQGTRPSTIGITVSTNQLSLLACIGEKYDACPTLSFSEEVLLRFMSLYWFTHSFSSSIYHYRYMIFWYRSTSSQRGDAVPKDPHGIQRFPKYDAGGHFAALAEPEALWSDIEEIIKENWE